jgi:Peptidase_C39 like family
VTPIVTPIVFWLIVALALANAGPAAASAAGHDRASNAVALDVPFVPQTEALCGGAAVAMVLRYWGEAHTGVQEFAPLVDRRARGIRTDALVRAVAAREWQADAGARSIESLRAELAAGHPIVVLIEDRPDRYHYVVVIGAAPDHFVVHDPAWGPSRRVATDVLTRRWQRANFWSLVILPRVRGVRLQPDLRQSDLPVRVRLKADATSSSSSDCDDLLTHAVDRVQQEGLDRADALFESVRAQCPEAAGPLHELAGVRFAQHRWRDAATLAEKAVAIDPLDEYAWEVLAASRFVQDDPIGALRAWNQIGKPRVDSVRIDGLTRTRYALVADALKLPTGSLLSAERFQRAERRLEEMPDASSARLGYRPQSDGFAGVDVAVVESSARPRGAREWAARGARAAIDREVAASIPGFEGQGDVWSASWRWWTNRPRVALSFATPRAGVLPGVWRVEASWERQTFQSASAIEPVREERTHGGVAVSDWLTSNLRYEISTGIDSWNETRRAAAVGGSIERRASSDRWWTTIAATTWMPLTRSEVFRSGAVRTGFRSSTHATGTTWAVESGLDAVTEDAPLSIWPGAGEGQARRPLLRAHPLLSNGIVRGPMFGRALAYATSEVQRWFGAGPIRIAAATFIDLAHASHRMASADSGEPFQIDAGVGVRIKAPGQKGALRIDVGRGLRDGSQALTIGWQPLP